MAEFKLGRIKFVWKDSWAAASTYYVDDVVRHGGKTFICVIGHTADTNFYTNLNSVPSKWNQLSDGQRYRENWATSVSYLVNDIVKYGGILYICNLAHTSAATTTLGLETDQSKWTQYGEGFDWKAVWGTNVRYKLNDIVRYGGYTYVCNLDHTSAVSTTSGLEADQSKWDIFNPGVEYKGPWSGSSVRYKLNDVVKQGAGLWICVTYHTSTASFISDESNWTRFVEAIAFENDWNNVTEYQPGDVVRYGGNQYISKTNHNASSPLTSATNWDLFSESFNFRNDWTYTTSYLIGDTIRLNGYTYLATTDISPLVVTVTALSISGVFTTISTAGFAVGKIIRFTSSIFSNSVLADATYYIKTVPAGGTTFTVSILPGAATFVPTIATASGSMAAVVTAMPPNTDYWTKLNSGISWRDVWSDDTEYVLGDAVRFGSNAYICVLTHRSEGDDGSTIGVQGGGAANSRPDNDITGTYWNLLSVGTETSVLTTTGDLVYFGGNGPTRLPIGREGQVLRAGDTYPEWVTLGEVDHNYFVAPHGTDLPSPIYGKTWDKPWKTIRYAAEQVEHGPRNPNAKYLLELNRAFIQREVTEWIDNQVSTNTAPFTTAFDYDEYRCERDTGFLIDALIYDLGHGGNVKTRGAAQALVGALIDSPGVYVTLSAEAEEDVAAWNQMLVVIESVLNNQAPAVNYQVLNGDNSTAIIAQTIDTDYTAEPGAMATVTELITVITDAVTAGNGDNIPDRYVPSNLINVATGQYREILPIIVPEKTCIIGDELRSTNAGPAGSIIDVADVKYSVGSLDRLENVIGDVILGNNVTETAGNTALQSQLWPYASSVEEITVKQLVRLIKHRIDFLTTTTENVVLTNPTGYNVGYLAGYGDAKTLLKENKDFIKAEIIAYIAVNYPTVKYSKTVCRRDVGYIIDAMIYDLTYGGTTQTLNAGLAYFDGAGSTSLIDSTEVGATIASYNRLKSVMQSIIINSTVTKSTGNTATQWTDATNLTTGSAASSFVGENIDIVTAILTAGSTIGRPNLTVTSITGTDTLNTTANHGLAAGDLIVPRTTAYGLTVDVRYYVIASGLTSTAFKVSTSYAGSAVTGLTNGTDLIYVVDTEDRPIATNAVTTTTALITAYTALSAAVGTIVTNMTSYLAANYPSLSYNSAKCQRDARIILDAVGYDFMFNGNFQTVKAAYAYLRSSASEVFSLNQKAATRAAFSYVKTQAKANVGGDTTAQARIETLMTTLDDVVFGATDEGQNCATGVRAADYAVLQLERNRSYLVSEITAYGAATYTTSISAATAATDLFTCASTSWMQRNAPIRFTGTVFGGITTGTTYYVQNVVSSTTFKISTTKNSNTAFDITANASGTMTVSLFYSVGSCERDINAYIDALKYDLKYIGNYKSRFSARYYANAVKGSLEEDMYYLRDGTGVRDMTLEGLTGDLLAPNALGTSRVSAGAYMSLDPGWGPDDYRAWINTRSPYVQGLTTLGYAAVGQKIDGALHNGGNDSIVSNDFTQVISDGIGAWITNNGRAELVSVFTYYSHIGYLAENGGRIRGTNGNNSYGDFGSVAEGFDATETIGTAVVNNQGYKALVGSVFTDATTEIFGFEFDNAGSDYTEAVWTITGPGTGATVVTDEYRDDAIFQTMLLDNVDDSTSAPEAAGNFGGFGYITNSNTAQGGTTTQVTIAATDGESSSAYIGMKIYITGGSGAGQFGIISTYNSGSKVATVVKESTGAAGWDHVVPGYPIAAPDASATYTIEPRIIVSDPGFTATAVTMPTPGTWASTVYGDTSSIYTSLTGTYSGSGASGATWQVIRNGSKYLVTNITAGTGYTRLQTITIAGTSLGGLTPTNDLVITVLVVNSVSGAIVDFDFSGYGLGGRFVAVRSGSVVGATSEDGISWTTRTGLMPSAAAWTSTAYGAFQDGSTLEKIPKFVAVAGGSANATAAYSADGITWSSADLQTSATWSDVAFGNSRFVAVASDSTTVRISQDGEAWDVTGTLATTGYNTVIYGRGIFVALRTGTTVGATSTTGVAWTTRTLPAASAWNSVAWGNNRFVAVATNSNSGAYSLDGITWTAMTVGSADGSTVGGWQEVKYGQGLFVATTYQAGVEDYSFVATSPDGITWTIRGVPGTDGSITGWNALAFGNPQRTGRWVSMQKDSGQQALSIRTGATALARAFVAEEKIFAIRMLEPGSGYDSLPTITIVDPNNTFEAPTLPRKGKGALANPTFTNRGLGYSAADAEIETGDGHGDFLQFGNVIAMKRLSLTPAPGSNVVFSHLPDQTFKLVNVLSLLGANTGSQTAFYQVSPEVKLYEYIPNGTTIQTRIRYSQVRLTGHDFLDIGTGNFSETNYPGLPTQEPIPANETVENGGGRVFYTSTDQDGNFRVGALFTIEQSTGIATLNADAFNIAGLQELSLGEVTLGGGSATISEFSTDPFFTADSDAVVPTQRAIKAYISGQIGGGGAALNVNSVTAGSIYIANTEITTTTNIAININAKTNFIGPIKGYPVAWNFFLR